MLNTTTNFFNTKRFVAMMACLSGMAALGIDSVLPTFPAIIDEFAIPEGQHNRIQQVVFVFMLGFASLQIVFGILADVFGRKIVLLSGLVIYVIASTSVFWINDFEHLLWARFFQGAGLSAPRVLTLTIVRDKVSGAAMSRIMSFITMVFLMIPVLAPIFGQLVIAFAPWRAVFLLLLLSGVVLLLWTAKELPETLEKSQRIPFSFSKLRLAVGTFSRSSEAQIYVLMISLLFGMLMTYVGLSEPILQKDIYHLGQLFPLFFGLVVTGMLAASIINAQFVLRWGMDKMVFIALCLLCLSDGLLFLTVMLSGGIIPLWLLITVLIIHFLGFGLAMPNLNAQCMQPFQHIAGTASALIGTVTTILGVFIAQAIGYWFDKTLYSFAIGYLLCTVCLWLLYCALKRTKNHRDAN